VTPLAGAALSSGDMVIATHGLSKRFGQRRAVDHLDMSVPRGTITGFVGPNGSGKTTTIRMLMGLVRPTSGSATVLGQDISRARKYLPRVGAVIESPAFYPGLSGRRNLETLAQFDSRAAGRVDSVLETVGLDSRAKDPVGKYSLGMKQRLALAMALLTDPELLILDEPTNGLDPLGVIELRDLLRSMRDQGKTFFISSHLLAELQQVCDWLVVILDGTAVFNGSARDLADRRDELTVEALETSQLDLVAEIASAEGYRVTRVQPSIRIACPVDWASDLERRTEEAGVTGVTIGVQKASLEERVLSLLSGGRT
jgi:ABC-2 type transport system ATP-binding protein